MRISQNIAERFRLDFSKTTDPSELISHLRDGGAAIALVGIPEGERIGLFSEEGHYILLLSTDGRELCILDPYYYEGKFKIPERLGRINEDNFPFLYCDVNTLHSQTHRKEQKYFLFKRSKNSAQ